MDLSNYTIGVIRGDSFDKELTLKGLKITGSNTADQCIKMLKNGRIDFYIGEKVSIIDIVRRLYPAETASFKFFPVIYGGKRQNTFIVSKSFSDAQAILDMFNKGLKIIKNYGEYDRI